jgi:predicted dehydrogenase
VRADLGGVLDGDPDGRLWNPELGASALLDLGVYPISFATWVLGRPSAVSGVLCAAIEASTTTARPPSPTTQEQLHRCRGARWRGPTTAPRSPGTAVASSYPAASPSRLLHFCPSRRGRQTGETPLRGRGYSHEAEEVMRCLRDGAHESPLLPLTDRWTS